MTAPALVRRWSDGGSTLARGDLLSRARDRYAGLRGVTPLAAVLLSALVVQVAVAPHLTLGGVGPDVVLVTVAAVAVARGPRIGAAFGFAAGLGADLFLATPPGTAALAYTLVGHAIGRGGRRSPSGIAAALCGPESPCFACRLGRRHSVAAGARAAPAGRGDAGEAATRPARRRRKAATRRAAVREASVLVCVAVGAGRLATAAVATALGGVAFVDAAGLVRVAATAAVSALLGPPVFAAGRRWRRPPAGGGVR